MIAFWFGRANPLTKGHNRLVNNLKQKALVYGCEARIYLSHLEQVPKNPLSYKDRLRYAREAFGDIVVKSDISGLFPLLKSFEQEGIKEVFWFTGSDRALSYERITQYNGQEFNFKTIKIISLRRTAKHISSTKMRSYALDGNKDLFLKGLPSKLSHKTQEEIYKKVKKKLAEYDNTII